MLYVEVCWEVKKEYYEGMSKFRIRKPKWVMDLRMEKHVSVRWQQLKIK